MITPTKVHLPHCTVNSIHWGFKPMFHYNRPYAYSTFIVEENIIKCIFLSTKPIPAKDVLSIVDML